MHNYDARLKSIPLFAGIYSATLRLSGATSQCLLTCCRCVTVFAYVLQVRQRYSEQYEYDEISNLLGMEKTSGMTVKGKKDSILPSL